VEAQAGKHRRKVPRRGKPNDRACEHRAREIETFERAAGNRTASICLLFTWFAMWAAVSMLRVEGRAVRHEKRHTSREWNNRYGEGDQGN
jgi:hypothetical protein